MQEHLPYKTTPEQGWSKMQSMLDQALPVEHRSRRYLAFWWTGAAAIGVSIISLLLLNERSKPLNGVPAFAPAKEITSSDHTLSRNENQNTTASSSQLTNDVKAISDNNTNDQIVNNKNLSSSIASNGTSSTNVGNNLSGKVNLSPVTQPGNSNMSDQQLNAEENINNASAEAVLINSIQPQSNPETSLATSELNSIRSQNRSIEFLPLADEMESEFSQLSVGPIEPGPYAAAYNRRPRFSPNVIAGAMIGTQNGLGSNIGFGTDFSMTSRINLTASIGYGSYQPNAFSFGSAKDEVLLGDVNAIIKTDTTYNGVNSYVDGEKVNASSDYNAVNSVIHSIRQWQVSAGLKYELTRRFYIIGGVSVGFGTTGKSEYPIVENGSFASADLSFTSSFDSSYDIIRSTMTSINAGLGYNITRHFNIYAQWCHGLDHYLLIEQDSGFSIPAAASEERTDYIRGLNVGLKYQL